MNRHICFVGDLFAGGRLLHQEPENLVRSSTYQNADLRIANLEHAIGTEEPISRKSTLHAPPEALDYLTELDVDAVSLANNHVHDLGPDGIGETIDHLASVGIDAFGAGRSLPEASEPYRVHEELVLFGYCAYDSPSLTKIQVATDEMPGINPLNREKIRDDLRTLNADTRAILYVHWGIENAWFPPSEALDLAGELLNHPQVAGIIGADPHRPQGYLSKGPKRAYFSIGDFLIPEFYLEPPVSVTNPPEGIEPAYKTKRYHPVTKLTRKIPTIGSRVSLLVTYDSERKRFNHAPLYQSKSSSYVHELTGWQEDLLRHWVDFSETIIDGPQPLNHIGLKSNRSLYKLWNISGILLFLYRQNGARWMSEFLSLALHSKFSPEIDTNERLYEFFSDT